MKRVFERLKVRDHHSFVVIYPAAALFVTKKQKLYKLPLENDYIELKNVKIMKDVVFLDKDNTLGEFFLGGVGLFPNVPQFLFQQKQYDRKLWIATAAKNNKKSDLTEVLGHLDGYLGDEQINQYAYSYYLRSDGVPRLVEDDYTARINLCSVEEQKKYREFLNDIIDRLDTLDLSDAERARFLDNNKANFQYFHALVHRETGIVFDDEAAYNNPYVIGTYWRKDLHLARRHIAPQGYKDLRTVMIGDVGDHETTCSDPETPLIMISDNVRQGNWDLVTRAIDLLFSDPSVFPYEMYDKRYSAQRDVERIEQTEKGVERSKPFYINQIPYVLRRFKSKYCKEEIRILECP